MLLRELAKLEWCSSLSKWKLFVVCTKKRMCLRFYQRRLREDYLLRSAALLFDYKHGKVGNMSTATGRGSVVVVVSPLVSLMTDQVSLQLMIGWSECSSHDQAQQCRESQPSLVVLQSAHNDIFDFLVDESARFFMHFVTHYGSAFSPRFCKIQSAVFALSGYALLCSAKPTCVMLRVFLSDNHFCLLVSGRGIYIP